MRNARSFAVVALILLAVTSSGCLDKVWSYDFTADTAKLEDWHYNGNAEYFNLTDEGLSMDAGTSGRIFTPVLFNGDISITVEMDVVGDEQGATDFDICLVDKKLGDDENCVFVSFKNLSSIEENWIRGVYSPEVDECRIYRSEVPFLDKDGPNTIELDKRGNTVKLSINEKLATTFDMSIYQAQDYYLLIWMRESSNGNIVIKKVDVKYGGTITLDPPTP